MDAAIKAQVVAIERGVEAELVQERITELEAERKQAQEALLAAAPEPADDASELAAALERLPDLSDRLEAAPLEV